MNKGFQSEVLDHGYVRYIDHMGSDERIVEAARISYKSPSKGPEADAKLLNYLYKNRHTSPFEMCKITFNIKMPIFVMRQYVRHRMQNLNEVSARYTQLPNEFYCPRGWRIQDTTNKQGSVIQDGFDPYIPGYSRLMILDDFGGYTEVEATASELVVKHAEESYKLYEALLKAGIAREQARMILPVNIYTEIYCCWDLKNLLHFIGLREDSHAQAEIQEYATAMKIIARDLFPVTIKAYEKYKWKVDENH